MVHWNLLLYGRGKSDGVSIFKYEGFSTLTYWSHDQQPGLPISAKSTQLNVLTKHLSRGNATSIIDILYIDFEENASTVQADSAAASEIINE